MFENWVKGALNYEKLKDVLVILFLKGSINSELLINTGMIKFLFLTIDH